VSRRTPADMNTLNFFSRYLPRVSLIFVCLGMLCCSEGNPGLEASGNGWRPREGYQWAHPGNSSDLSVKPAPGYAWVNPHDDNDFAVVSTNPTPPRLVIPAMYRPLPRLARILHLAHRKVRPVPSKLHSANRSIDRKGQMPRASPQMLLIGSQ
jgi:hypothetical protein